MRSPIADAIIDTDEGVAFDQRAVDEHRGELSTQDLLDDGMPVGEGEYAEAIDHGVADALALVFIRRAGHEEQRLACALGHPGQRGEELDRVRVGERPREGFGEHDADGAGSTAAQRPAGGVRPTVPEAGGGLEDRARRSSESWSGREYALETVVRETPIASAIVCSVTFGAMGCPRG